MTMVCEKVAAKYHHDPLKESLIKAEVHAQRSEDADLSSLGQQQALVNEIPLYDGITFGTALRHLSITASSLSYQLLSDYLQDRLSGRKLLIVSSPMKRAIKTILPFAQAALSGDRTRWLCFGKYHEVGGCYLQSKVRASQ